MTVTLTLKDLHGFLVGALVGSLIACHPNIEPDRVAVGFAYAVFMMSIVRIVAAGLK